ncbi:hypothetical protein DM77_3715 [Burkholderia mallei]|nr:hypothetical protein DM77_3715 [Burkholderia mallei]
MFSLIDFFAPHVAIAHRPARACPPYPLKWRVFHLSGARPAPSGNPTQCLSSARKTSTA